jgi:hypothetical protein
VTSRLGSSAVVVSLASGFEGLEGRQPGTNVATAVPRMRAAKMAARVFRFRTARLSVVLLRRGDSG